MDNKLNEEEIDLIDLFMIVWKWKWLTICVVFTSVIVSILFIYNKNSSLRNIFTSSAQIQVGELYNIVIEDYESISKNIKNNKYLEINNNNNNIHGPLVIDLKYHSPISAQDSFDKMNMVISKIISRHDKLLNSGINNSKKYKCSLDDACSIALLSLSSYTFPTRVLEEPQKPKKNDSMQRSEIIKYIVISIFAGGFFGVFLSFMIEFSKSFLPELKKRMEES